MFKNLTIKARLVSVIAFLSALVVSIGAVGLLGMQKANDGLRTVYEDRVVGLRYLSQVERVLTSDRLQMANAIIDGSPQALKTSIQRLEANIA
ncbi:MAG: multi-sensor signal transduction histidine kinase, partial [Betaproteobacteria bacterium]|nr:multi-sensor signal transduction histidine kinase [Betaproteobacteria bacterium]